ncbi:putative odorant receptor OR17 [Danaus plexippus plexippus]|uniref:Odorant receptor OR17 n=1 Tax=Danaus plexippus plexippus TaxID=278856 RepID=A0A212EKQ5_DANPL|nr:putative odorant receptor OR17 [Danaus plexippus plexippus]
MAVIKYTKLHTYREAYHKLYHHFRYDIWDIVSSNSPSHQKIIKRYKWITKSINRFLFYYSIPLIVFVDSFPYLVMIYENKFNYVTDQYLYPFDGWYPFDRVKWYAAVYVWESCMTAIVVFVYVFSNMIHTSYIAFICMELRILGSCLDEIRNPEDVIGVIGRTKKDVHNTVIRKLKVIISKHEYLAKTAAKLNLVLGDAMLLNYSLGSIFICLTAFTSTMVDNLYKSLRYFFMCVSLLVEIFNQCVIGQILSDHSVGLSDTIYSWDWTSASPEAKKIILLFIMRTQKPFKLTGNGYIIMNMDTFSRIMSSSYQFFNLLRTIYR